MTIERNQKHPGTFVRITKTFTINGKTRTYSYKRKISSTPLPLPKKSGTFVVKSNRLTPEDEAALDAIARLPEPLWIGESLRELEGNWERDFAAIATLTTETVPVP